MKGCSHVIGAAALTAAGALCGAAQAEPGQFAGAFVVHSDDLDLGAGVQIFSGYAIAELQDNGTYRVRMMLTDFFQSAEGVLERTYSVQVCTGQLNGIDMTLTCDARSTSGHNSTPRNFLLRHQGSVGPSVWQGRLSPNGTVPVEFLDLD